MDKLYIVIPAYNEEINIRAVVEEWHDVTVKTGADSRLVVVDDGSKDNTYNILSELSTKLPRLIALTKPNGGHGAAILYGYRYALEHGAEYVFQTDSDGQTVAAEFWQFWKQRGSYSALIGCRTQRKDGYSRVFVTNVLRFVLWRIFHLNIPDANAPFRLISAAALRKYIEKIPPEFNLSNVLLTVCLVAYNESIKFIPITFRQRQGGTNSINMKKIIKIGFQAIKDFTHIRKELKKNDKHG